MALGLASFFKALLRADTVSLCSNSSLWVTAVGAGGPATADNASITNPTLEIVAATTVILNRDARLGTTIKARLQYDTGMTGITSPVIKLFGRTTDPSTKIPNAWQALYTLSGNLTATLATAATDVDDGTYKYTNPTNLDNAWDCDGCDEILVGIQTALSGTGTTSNSKILLKIV